MQSSSLLKKPYILILLGVLFLVFSIIPFYAFLPACVYWELKPAVANGDELNQEVGFFVLGSFARLHVYVSGGDKQITAYLMDSSGNIFDQGLVDNSGVFYLHVPRNDYYNLYLKNDFKWLSQNDKQILVKVYYYLYQDFFLFSGLIMLILGYGLTLWFELKPKPKRLRPIKDEES